MINFYSDVVLDAIALDIYFFILYVLMHQFYSDIVLDDIVLHMNNLRIVVLIYVSYVNQNPVYHNLDHQIMVDTDNNPN